MPNEPNLEDRLRPESSVTDQTIDSHTPQEQTGWRYQVKNYLVDCSATTLFYTPLMATTEYLSGMDSEEILKSRAMGAVAHFAIGRPYAVFRQWWAKAWNTDAQSSRLKKAAVDTSAMVLMQAPIYTSMLYAAGASAKEIAIALPTGLTLGALSGRPFGYVLDKWRKLFGTKPVLDQ